MNKKALFNSIWMMSEKIISIFGLIFVTSYVAKYVGPSIYGEIMYATTIFQIAQVASQLGSDVVIFKRISKNHISGIKLINATLPIRVIIYLIIAVPTLLMMDLNNFGRGFYFSIACFIAGFFSSLDIFSTYFNALLKAKINTYVNIVSISIALLVRWLISFFKLDPVLLSFPIVLSSFLPFIFRCYIYRHNFNIRSSLSSHKKKYTVYLLKVGSTFVVATIAVSIYLRLSFISINYFYGKEMLGVFSVANNLGTAWIFICTSFINSYMPAIFKETNDTEVITKVVKLKYIIVFISLLIISFVAIIGHWFIDVFYGKHFIDAYIPMLIICFATMISSLSTITSRYIARYSGYLYLSKKSFALLFISAILNFCLVKYNGVNGAAIAIVITEIISLTISNYFFNKGMVLKLHKSIFMMPFLILFKTKGK